MKDLRSEGPVSASIDGTRKSSSKNKNTVNSKKLPLGGIFILSF